MRGTSKKRIMWGMGLEEADEALIRSVGRNDFTLIMLPEGNVPSAKDMDRDEPSLVWIAKSSWDYLKKQPVNVTRHLEIVPRVLLLGGQYSMHELEDALDSGFTDVIKPPLTEARIRDVLMRAAETHNLYHDIIRMTREICLERELLERKNDILSFIVSFLSRATESLEPLEIMQSAQEDLALLLPITATGAVCWAPGAGRRFEAGLYVPVRQQHGAYDEWVTLLLASAEKLSSRSVDEYHTEYLAPAEAEAHVLPEAGKVVILPLKTGGETLGAFALLARNEIHLGKDQLQILKSAMRHLALALKNAMLYREVKQHADLDGLTLVHNRRHFDARLAEETERHIRYAQPFTLMMLDIDHFKPINDTYGHQAGDAVLKQLAGLLRSTLRTTDYVARYGGEEFVVILPYTPDEQAILLAERLRGTIETHSFSHEGVRIPVTVSIGLSPVPETQAQTAEQILGDADRALYRAKACGRNRVCSATQCHLSPSTGTARIRKDGRKQATQAGQTGDRPAVGRNGQGRTGNPKLAGNC